MLVMNVPPHHLFQTMPFPVSATAVKLQHFQSFPGDWAIQLLSHYSYCSHLNSSCSRDVQGKELSTMVGINSLCGSRTQWCWSSSLGNAAVCVTQESSQHRLASDNLSALLPRSLPMLPFRRFSLAGLMFTLPAIPLGFFLLNFVFHPYALCLLLFCACDSGVSCFALICSSDQF